MSYGQQFPNLVQSFEPQPLQYSLARHLVEALVAPRCGFL